jgi:diguanylate cyclase (GGDEF)-like protein
VLLPATDRDGARIMAERICREIRSLELEHDGRLVSSTASLGVAATAPGQALSLDALLRLADRALYEAKRRGKDRVVVA